MNHLSAKLLEWANLGSMWAAPNSLLAHVMTVAYCTGSPLQCVRHAQCCDCCRDFLCVRELVLGVSELSARDTMKTMRNHKTNLILGLLTPSCLGLNLGMSVQDWYSTTKSNPKPSTRICHREPPPPCFSWGLPVNIRSLGSICWEILLHNSHGQWWVNAIRRKQCFTLYK